MQLLLFRILAISLDFLKLKSDLIYSIGFLKKIKIGYFLSENSEFRKSSNCSDIIISNKFRYILIKSVLISLSINSIDFIGVKQTLLKKL